jgi:NTE family protein
VPGLFPPITLKGRRYMDGGMRSMTNADLARGHERIVVVAVVAGPSGSPLAARYLAPLQREVDALRESGHQVEVVTPDVSCIEAFGANLMDYSRRSAAAINGLRQGRIEAEKLKAFW